MSPICYTRGCLTLVNDNITKLIGMECVTRCYRDENWFTFNILGKSVMQKVVHMLHNTVTYDT